MSTSPFSVILTDRDGAAVRYPCPDLGAAKKMFYHCTLHYSETHGISIVEKGKRSAYDPKYCQVPTSFLRPR